jgi:hypothetical protein
MMEIGELNLSILRLAVLYSVFRLKKGGPDGEGLSLGGS